MTKKMQFNAQQKPQKNCFSNAPFIKIRNLKKIRLKNLKTPKIIQIEIKHKCLHSSGSYLCFTKFVKCHRCKGDRMLLRPKHSEFICTALLMYTVDLTFSYVTHLTKTRLVYVNFLQFEYHKPPATLNLKRINQLTFAIG